MPPGQGQPTIFPSIWQTIINTLLRRALAPFIDTTNTATAATSVTINGDSGLAVFTANIGSASSNLFTITNSSITANSLIGFWIKYSNNGDGIIVPNGYYTDAGHIYLPMFNVDPANGTNQNIAVSFKILS